MSGNDARNDHHFCHTPLALDAAVNFNSLHYTLHRHTISVGDVAIPRKRGEGLHVVLTARPRLACLCLADALV